MSEQIDNEKVVDLLNDIHFIAMAKPDGTYEIKVLGVDGRIYLLYFFPEAWSTGTEYHEITVFRAASVRVRLK